VTNALGAIRWVDAGAVLPTGVELAATDVQP
jgi:hypothetical protein